MNASILVRWGIDPFNEGGWAVWCPGQIARLPALLSAPHDVGPNLHGIVGAAAFTPDP